MVDLSESCLSIINSNLFHFTNIGPLHGPIQQFTLTRDDKLTLILETTAPPDAKSSAIAYPSGTVRLNTENAMLTSVAGLQADLLGITSKSRQQYWSENGDSYTKECSLVRQASVNVRECVSPAYIIEWLENLPSGPFIWPDIQNLNEETSTVRKIGSPGAEIEIPGNEEHFSHSRSAARLTITGRTLYLCALDPRDVTGSIHPGCIVYEGVPEEGFRKKVRNAISLALGIYLVELGHTTYSSEWHIVSALAKSGYSMNGRAFDISHEQPAPLGPKYLWELDRSQLNRAVTALVENYDSLDLGNLGWAYWHACTATPHIAPAHFGAAIEGLLKSFMQSLPAPIPDTWLQKREWRCLRGQLRTVISGSGASSDIQEGLTNNLLELNKIDFRTRLRLVFGQIGLDLGDDENAAWRRRNLSAHGMAIREGEELAAIRDMKLLKGLFHRLLVRITDMADQYIDYTTPGHPYRQLKEPAASLPKD